MSIYVDIEKNLGSFRLKVKFEAADETIALLGASGCGKSMTLKCIAGIEKPDQGRIILDGVTLFDSEKKINLTPQQRHTGLMFQNYALFPNMTVLQNIQAGAKREKNKAKRQETVDSVMESFGLAEFADRYPHQLSGGQQQRVALARILVSSPRILLLDEPFSALDSHLRFKLEQEVRQVIRKFGKTVILVSHDRDEVYRMSDKIAIMSAGRVDALGTNEEIFTNPRTRAGATLTGCKNISAVRHVGTDTVYASEWGIELKLPNLTKETTSVGIRMRRICPGKGENTFHCKVVEEIEDPFYYTVMLRPFGADEGSPLGWLMSKEEWLRMRAPEVEVHLPPESILLLHD